MQERAGKAHDEASACKRRLCICMHEDAEYLPDEKFDEKALRRWKKRSTVLADKKKGRVVGVAAFPKSPCDHEAHGMNKILADNSSFAISDAEALDAVRAFNRKCEEHAAMEVGSRPETFCDECEAATLEDHQATIDDPCYQAARDAEGTPPDCLPGWEEDLIAGARFNLAYQRGVQLQKLRARARARTALRAGGYRTQTRVRARRSPASSRRATADSGGDDGGGSGDPEPPRPRCNVSQIFCGGASL